MNTQLLRLICLTGLVLFWFVASKCCGEEVNIDTLIKIESGGFRYAYNQVSGARGLMQVTPICLEEWNQQSKTIDQYTIQDLFNPEVNKQIGTWYINTKIPHYLINCGLEDTIENRLIAYNWGIGNLKRYKSGRIKELPNETKQYIKKYRRENEL